MQVDSKRLNRGAECGALYVGESSSATMEKGTLQEWYYDEMSGVWGMRVGRAEKSKHHKIDRQDG